MLKENKIFQESFKNIKQSKYDPINEHLFFSFYFLFYICNILIYVC